MKKLITALLVFTLLLAVGATALAKTYYIKTQSGNYVYVRSGRGTDYERIGKLVYGDHIDVVDIKDGWAKFNFGAYGYGYVSANFLSKTKPEAIDNSKSNTKSNTSSNSKNESSTSSSSGTFDLVKVYEKFTNVSYTAVVQPSTSSKTQGSPNTLRPIINPSAPVHFRHFLADSPPTMSPLAITGILSCSLTLRMVSQSATPE